MRFLLLTLCCTLPLLAQVAQAKPELYPVEYFAQIPMYKNPVLSPDGRRMVVAMMQHDEQKMVVMKLMTPGDEEPEPIVPLSSGDHHFNWWQWVNNDRLMASIRIRKDVAGQRSVVANGQRLTLLNDVGTLNLHRLTLIDRTGENFKNVAMKAGVNGWMLNSARLVHLLPDDPDHVLAQVDMSDKSFHPYVSKVNVTTGRSKRIQYNPYEVDQWIADNNGVVRIGQRYESYKDETEATFYYRKTADDEWEILANSDIESERLLWPIRFHETDPNILLVSSDELSDSKKRNESGLFEFDLTTRKIVGNYVDQEKKEVMDLIRKALPDFKVQFESRSRDKNRYIVRVYSDTVAPLYYLLDIKKELFTVIGLEFPDLFKKPMSKMKKVSYNAIDGMKIPAFLTLPTGMEEKNLPLIVYPHGGPNSHDSWGFNNYVQFFANRGYAVLQPQFRGSTGYGSQHERAGYRQWGLAMQNDITDGVKWLIKEGIVDRKRICIVGASYGGYAASMGLVKTPDLYACGISVNGVHNLPELIEHVGGGFNVKRLNPKPEAEKVSPYHQAHKITKPLLLIAEQGDLVVDYHHSKNLYEKMKALNKNVDYVEIEGGEHWRTDQPHERIKMKAMDEFLAKYLQPQHN